MQANSHIPNIQLPGSKSISNRLLMIRAIGELSFEIDNFSDSDDTLSLIKVLNEIKNDASEIDIHHAGTNMRFLCSYLATRVGKTFILTGSERMKERPIKELVDVLRLIGAEINYLNKDGYPPIQITGKKLNATTIHIDASVSSQFISSLLLIAPIFENGCEIVLKGDVVSPGYIHMTIELMRVFGIKVEWMKDTIQVEKGSYKTPRSNIFNESDWSAAGYFYNALLFSGLKEIKLSGLIQNSIQPDSVTAKLFTPFGIDTIFEKDVIVLKKQTSSISYFEYDFTDCPDIAQTLAVTCVGTGIKAKLSGLRTLKIKETDRISALKNELEKFGAEVIVTADSLEINKIDKANMKETITVKTYNDHRMAMSFAAFKFIYPNLQIEDDQVVSKSFPQFWNELKKLDK